MPSKYRFIFCENGWSSSFFVVLHMFWDLIIWVFLPDWFVSLFKELIDQHKLQVIFDDLLNGFIKVDAVLYEKEEILDEHTDLVFIGLLWCFISRSTWLLWVSVTLLLLLLFFLIFFFVADESLWPKHDMLNEIRYLQILLHKLWFRLFNSFLFQWVDSGYYFWRDSSLTPFTIFFRLPLLIQVLLVCLLFWRRILFLYSCV